MGCSSPSKSKSQLCNFVLLIVTFLCFRFIIAQTNTAIISSSTNYSLVFSHCPNNHTTAAASPPLNSPELLSSLFRELVDESSRSTSFHTYVGDDTIAISGRFQCRYDVSDRDCHVCVNELPGFSTALCGQTVPARVQLSGCYLHYQAEEDDSSAAGTEPGRFRLLHSKCSHKRADDYRDEPSRIEELRLHVLAELERCVVENVEEKYNYGFCKLSYESVSGAAQCAGNLGGCECGECVSAAAQMAQDECGYSASGEIYLDDCFLSYKYDKDYDEGSDSRNNKMVAIAVGSIAAIFIMVAVLSLISRRKKYDDWS